MCVCVCVCVLHCICSICSKNINVTLVTPVTSAVFVFVKTSQKGKKRGVRKESEESELQEFAVKTERVNFLSVLCFISG